MSNRPRKAVRNSPRSAASKGKGAQAPSPGARIEVRVNGVRLRVSPELEAAVLRAHKGSTQPLPREMTTTQAAQFLDVSRPFVIRLVERGELPCRKVGKHRRIPSEALVDHRDRMFQAAKQAADEMAQQSQDMGLYDLEGPCARAD